MLHGLLPSLFCSVIFPNEGSTEKENAKATYKKGGPNQFGVRNKLNMKPT